jgi:predicted histidine transporter YuiF (NhaC family)
MPKIKKAKTTQKNKLSDQEVLAQELKLNVTNSQEEDKSEDSALNDQLFEGPREESFYPQKTENHPLFFNATYLLVSVIHCYTLLSSIFELGMQSQLGQARSTIHFYNMIIYPLILVFRLCSSLSI